MNRIESNQAEHQKLFGVDFNYYFEFFDVRQFSKNLKNSKRAFYTNEVTRFF